MSTGILHRAAGLTIAADAPIPGLPAAPAGSATDVYIHLGATPPWQHRPFDVFHRAAYLDADSRPMVTVSRTGSGYRFSYSDGTTIWIDGGGTEVWASAAPHATLEDTATYLTGPILGFVLRRRGCVALHASAVKAGDGALIMVGPHGAGKSTTAAALAVRGWPLITDDVLRLQRSASDWMAEPFAAGLRLWPDAASLVLGSDVALRPLTPTWDKRALDSGDFGVTAAHEPTAVRSILFLEWSECRNGDSGLAPIGAAESVVRLATNGSASHLLNDEERAREFHALTDLVSGVRTCRAVATREPGSFGGFVERVRRWAVEGAHA